MNFYARGFNLYLLLVAVSLTAACGCQSDKDKAAKHVSALRFYIENGGQLPDGGQTVSVIRANPVLVTINTEPALTEANIISAKLLDSPVGYAVEIKFDETGTYLLEQYTSAYEGKHFVIFGQWSDKVADSRWLAAPIIVHRIASGVFAFTPDASLEEARQLVIGLNNMAEKIAKGKMK
jgi:preprotein translocase subunit SecD